ncbi:MAG: hypothetical protein ACTHKG_12230 [Nocardioides sp.]
MSFVVSRTRRIALAGAGGLLMIAALAGCSSDTTEKATDTAATPSPSTSSAPGTSSADVCAAVDTAKASLQALLDTDVAREGTDTVKTRLATLQSDVATLVDAGKDELAPKTAAVKDSVATLEDALAGLKEDPTAADLPPIRAALQAVKTSVEDLVTALRAGC